MQTKQEVKDFEGHFIFQTVIEVKGQNEEDVIDVIDDKINETIVQIISSVMYCGMGYDLIEESIKQVNDDLFTATLLWSGSYMTEVQPEKEKSLEQETNEARENVRFMLNKNLGTFKEVMEKISKKRDFHIIELKEKEITDVYEVHGMMDSTEKSYKFWEDQE